MARRLEGREPGHADIHEHDVGAQVAGFFHRVTGIGRFADYFKIGFALQQPPHSLAEQSVIVHKQAFDLWHESSFSVHSGDGRRGQFLHGLRPSNAFSRHYNFQARTFAAGGMQPYVAAHRMYPLFDSGQAK